MSRRPTDPCIKSNSLVRVSKSWHIGHEVKPSSIRIVYDDRLGSMLDAQSYWDSSPGIWNAQDERASSLIRHVSGRAFIDQTAALLLFQASPDHASTHSWHGFSFPCPDLASTAFFKLGRKGKLIGMVWHPRRLDMSYIHDERRHASHVGDLIGLALHISAKKDILGQIDSALGMYYCRLDQLLRDSWHRVLEVMRTRRQAYHVTRLRTKAKINNAVFLGRRTDRIRFEWQSIKAKAKAKQRRSGSTLLPGPVARFGCTTLGSYQLPTCSVLHDERLNNLSQQMLISLTSMHRNRLCSLSDYPILS
ncbi:uncharacterized protein MYCFIDRAFT_179303 [Pseudocercospora fijiensis CIRAD86]|uniref:Uncharacterized protein n=1 Tax=Pseudocercospora fijiensis (strain CIRAD86) TaxID=383855 RepID=M2ZFC7_PSEFD|nr:uncharacterized protein MYCFIDRAFT_179303 [Pseudocercospora fijiensis CIRAD86]EME77824.1 hypothetical protein MYCFIDRAFT_179303 [Pseudocercospora fijiensis CIRAD86]